MKKVELYTSAEALQTMEELGSFVAWTEKAWNELINNKKFRETVSELALMEVKILVNEDNIDDCDMDDGSFLVQGSFEVYKQDWIERFFPEAKFVEGE